MAETTKDRVTKAEAGTSIGSGILGGLLGTVLTNRGNPALGITSQLGKVLFENRDQITAPFFSRLSAKDEQIYAGIELQLTDEERDIMTLLLKRMGLWASNNFRGLVIAIPNPKSIHKKTVKKNDGTETVEENDIKDAPTDTRLLFLRAVIGDIIRFGKPGVDQVPPNYENGIEEVLKNLKIRNYVDADSATAKISRWWNEKPLEGKGGQARDFFLKELGVKKVEDVTWELLEAKVKEYTNKIDVPDPTLPRPNDTAGLPMRIARRLSVGSFPNAPCETPSRKRGKLSWVVALVIGFIVAFGTLISGYMLYVAEKNLQEIINQPIQPAEKPGESAFKGAEK